MKNILFIPYLKSTSSMNDQKYFITAYMLRKALCNYNWMAQNGTREKQRSTDIHTIKKRNNRHVQRNKLARYHTDTKSIVFPLW